MTKGQHYRKQENGLHCDNIELVKAASHKRRCKHVNLLLGEWVEFSAALFSELF